MALNLERPSLCYPSGARTTLKGYEEVKGYQGSPRVLVVGAGTRFLSAMSYYTIRLTNALAERFAVAVIPMRQLIPTFLYPGRSRVGSTTTWLDYDRSVEVLQGIDWYWIPNLFRDLNDLRRWRPDVVIFEWWTGTVLHTYLAIALVARVLGASLIVEFHEVLDSGEERIPLARGWVWALGRPFFRLASAFVIHSDADRGPLERRYRLRGRPCVLIPLGPHDHHASKEPSDGSAPVTLRTAPPDTLNLLFFGIIRPYKGLEDLVRAFDTLDDEEVKCYWLTVVGETWEGWDLPIRLIQSSRHRARITLVNRFVEDDEVIAHFAGADAVVLPYHRSSASSPAHVRDEQRSTVGHHGRRWPTSGRRRLRGSHPGSPARPNSAANRYWPTSRTAWTTLSRPPLLGSDRRTLRGADRTARKLVLGPPSRRH